MRLPSQPCAGCRGRVGRRIYVLYPMLAFFILFEERTNFAGHRPTSGFITTAVATTLAGNTSYSTIIDDPYSADGRAVECHMEKYGWLIASSFRPSTADAELNILTGLTVIQLLTSRSDVHSPVDVAAGHWSRRPQTDRHSEEGQNGEARGSGLRPRNRLPTVVRIILRLYKETRVVVGVCG